LSISDYEIRLLPAAGYDVSFVAETDSLGFAFDAQSGTHAIGSDRQRAFFRLPNSLALTPRGCDVRSSSPEGGEYLLIAGRSIRTRTSDYRSNIRNRRALPAASEIRKWLLMGACPGSLEAEALIGHLQDAARHPVPCEKAAHWMTVHRFRRVTDLIEAGLDTDLTVARLAREIGVSASFLSRAFSAYCGQSPYDFIVSRRVRRARHLIATTDRPLAEIALAAGFSSQSHMSASLKTRTGLPPSKISRREQRPG